MYQGEFVEGEITGYGQFTDLGTGSCKCKQAYIGNF